MIEGLLLVDKPIGISSFGVVAKVRKIISDEIHKEHIKRGYCRELSGGLSGGTRCKCRIKIGHTGTLDPMATGLLILAIGSYTKKVPLLIKQDKTYIVEMTLGKISTTGDKEGSITALNDKMPNKQAILDALAAFTGEFLQVPPAYSALKVNGQRAYDLARKGKEVSLPPRLVKVYGNELMSYDYPVAVFTSDVASGTYIRSLVKDIGDALGTGAYMSNLRRTQVGDFDIKDAATLVDLLPETLGQLIIQA